MVVVAHALDLGFAVVGVLHQLVKEHVAAVAGAGVGDGRYELVEVVGVGGGQEDLDVEIMLEIIHFRLGVFGVLCVWRG